MGLHFSLLYLLHRHWMMWSSSTKPRTVYVVYREKRYLRVGVIHTDTYMYVFVASASASASACRSMLPSNGWMTY